MALFDTKELAPVISRRNFNRGMQITAVSKEPGLEILIGITRLYLCCRRITLIVSQEPSFEIYDHLARLMERQVYQADGLTSRLTSLFVLHGVYSLESQVVW